MPVILTLLPSPEALADVTKAVEVGSDTRTDKPIVAEMSTFSEATKLQARDALLSSGVVALDCPISGTAVQAQAGDLVIYASGDDDAIDRCAAVFSGMSRGVHRLGALEWALG